MTQEEKIARLAAKAHAHLEQIHELRREAVANRDTVGVIMLDVLASKQHEILDLLERHQAVKARSASRAKQMEAA